MIDRTQFWKLIDEARSKTSKVTDIPGWLIAFLKEKPVEDICGFEEQRMEAQVNAYDARLWTAAYLMMDGCGDDTFVDFRDWLIAQGRSVYEQALDNPDTLAELDQTNGEHGRPLLFSFGCIAATAHEQKTGLYSVPIDFGKYRKPPLLNKEFEYCDADPVKLSINFPKLYAKFTERQERRRANPVFKPWNG